MGTVAIVAWLFGAGVTLGWLNIRNGDVDSSDIGVCLLLWPVAFGYFLVGHIHERARSTQEGVQPKADHQTKVSSEVKTRTKGEVK